MKVSLNYPKAPGKVIPFYFEDNAFFILDQRFLPLKMNWVKCLDYHEVSNAISLMMVRGAPAIGISASVGLALAFSPLSMKSEKLVHLGKIQEIFTKAKNALWASRPTAVNLGWALDRLEKYFLDTIKNSGEKKSSSKPQSMETQDVFHLLLKEAFKIWQEEIESNAKISSFGADLLPPGGVLTHCNTGSLATGGLGTALGVIKKKAQVEKGSANQRIQENESSVHVYADETRPYLQGSRLTAYELHEEGIPFDIITDSTAASIMDKGLVNSIIVGADRITLNGDTANKIGTLNIAILAKYFGIPFYVAAPISSFDFSSPNGSTIPIEERNSSEITEIQGKSITLDYPVINYAFDITPHSLINAIITEKGIIHSPNTKKIQNFFE